MSTAPAARHTALLVALLAVHLPEGIRADDATPAPDAAIRAACERMFDWVVTYDIRFRDSSAVFSDSSRPALDRMAEFALDCPLARIVITGHADALGDEAYNQALSEQRAKAVADFLAQRGLDRERLRIVGAGSSRPIADNGTPRGRERNRRIEFELQWPE
jgi:outer membrane protein OmpA-like peptidoglycan-associated protein